MSQHDTLTQALQDAASSLETISRLAGKAAYPNGDETCMVTFPEVRGYATSRAAVARAAISATHPDQAKQSDAASEVFTALADHCPVDNGWFNGRAAQGAGEVVGTIGAGWNDGVGFDVNWLPYSGPKLKYGDRLYTDTQPAAGADVVPEHVALLNEKVRELEARDAFEAQNKCSLGFKRSARGTYVNPPVARDWKWFRLGVQHANKDAS